MKRSFIQVGVQKYTGRSVLRHVTKLQIIPSYTMFFHSFFLFSFFWKEMDMLWVCAVCVTLGLQNEMCIYIFVLTRGYLIEAWLRLLFFQILIHSLSKKTSIFGFFSRFQIS